MSYSELTYALIALFLTYMILTRKYDLFHLPFFLAPIQSWYLNVGLNVTAFQVSIVILLLCNFAKAVKSPSRNIFNFKNNNVLIFLSYSLIVTLAMSTFIVNDIVNYGGFFRSEGRNIAQIALWLLLFSIIPLGYNYIKQHKKILEYLKSYLCALILLMVLGWVQLIVYSTISTDIYPLYINKFGGLKSGIWNYYGGDIFRISSLGGEPKGFAQSLVTGFFVIHTANWLKIRFFKYDSIIKNLMILTSFATLSTSGFVLFIILMITHLSYRLFEKDIKIRFTLKSFLLTCGFISLMTVFIFNNQRFIGTIINDRIVERDVIREDYDAPIQSFLFENPSYIIFGSGVGNIHILASKYIPNEYSYMDGTIFVAKSGYLKILSEIGVIGMLIFIVMNLKIYKDIRLNSNESYYNTIQFCKFMKAMLVIAFFSYLARVYVTSQYILILGLSTSLIQLQRRIILQKYAINSTLGSRIS